MKYFSLPILALLVGLFCLTGIGVVYAQQSSDESATIAELQATIDSLKQQIAALQGGGESSSVADLSPITRTLGLGDQGPEVRTLQKLLNAEFGISVAASGAGSPGNETTYFGPRTEQAVVAFQEKYAGQILAPLRLESGTGLVGPATRKKLNSLLNSADSTPTGSDTSPSQDDDSDDDEPSFIPDASGISGDVNDEMLAGIDRFLLAFVSENVVSHGDMITVSGAQFSEHADGLRVVFNDDYEVSDTTIRSDNRLSFQVPERIPTDRYTLTLTDGTETAEGRALLIIKDTSSAPPTVTDVSPSTVQYGETVTVTGSNFASENNEIRANYGLISDVSSPDGETLEFTVEPYAEYFGPDAEQELGETWEMPVRFQIANRYGISESSGEFTFTAE